MEIDQIKDSPRPDETKNLSNAQKAELRTEWINELVAGCRTQEDLFGPDGVFTRLKGAVMERLLEAEMSHHLGHERGQPRRGTNARNGHSKKTVHTESGSVAIQVPRDREGSFEPQLVGKHQRRLEGFDDKVLALYARGMTTRDIAEHLRELYGTDVSHELISKATAHVVDEFRAWQMRPLEAVYPVVYIDAIFVGVRDGAALPEKVVHGKCAGQPIRAALRPATIERLKVEDYDRARKRVTIRDSADKARFGRELPLTERAWKALEKCARSRGRSSGEPSSGRR